MLMVRPSLLAAEPHCHSTGASGGYKSQKINFFSSKIHGHSKLGSRCVGEALGMVQLFEGGGWNSPLGRETEARSGVTLGLGKCPCASVSLRLQGEQAL